MVCQRSPSGCGSGFEAWNGSSNTSTAVSNDRPCLTPFAAALSGSHVQRTAASACSYKYGATTVLRQGLWSRLQCTIGRLSTFGAGSQKVQKPVIFTLFTVK